MPASYAAGDPRANLIKATQVAPPPRLVMRGCGYGAFCNSPPQIVEPDGARTWLIRGAHTVVAVSEVREGTVLSRANNADEYMAMMDADGSATCSAGHADTIEACPGSVTIVPPGQSHIICHRDGHVVRCFTTRAEDLLALALILLRHSFCSTGRWRIWPQQGHLGMTRARVRARRIRSVAIEFGMWRWERSGKSSGSITVGKGRLRAAPGLGRS